MRGFTYSNLRSNYFLTRLTTHFNYMYRRLKEQESFQIRFTFSLTIQQERIRISSLLDFVLGLLRSVLRQKFVFHSILSGEFISFTTVFSFFYINLFFNFFIFFGLGSNPPSGMFLPKLKVSSFFGFSVPNAISILSPHLTLILLFDTQAQSRWTRSKIQ